MLYIILSVIVATALGFLLNLAANLIQPHVENKTRLIVASIGFLLVATIAITFQAKRSSSSDVVSPVSPDDNSAIVTADTISHFVYEAKAQIEEGKSYVDSETGFVFAVDEIANSWLSKLLAPNAGVLCRYTLPDGTASEIYRRKVGTRVDFLYRGRKYFMAIKDVDYPHKIATITIKEYPHK